VSEPPLLGVHGTTRVINNPAPPIFGIDLYHRCRKRDTASNLCLHNAPVFESQDDQMHKCDDLADVSGRTVEKSWRSVRA